MKQVLEPGESKSVTFMLTWHFPNRRAWDHGTHHAGNYGGEDIVGNYYTTLYKDAWDVAEKTAGELEALENEIVHKTIELGGSVSGEHGIGQHRMKYMKAEHGESYKVMRAIKQLFDPNNILCPGTVFKI